MTDEKRRERVGAPAISEKARDGEQSPGVQHVEVVRDDRVGTRGVAREHAATGARLRTRREAVARNDRSPAGAGAEERAEQRHCAHSGRDAARALLEPHCSAVGRIGGPCSAKTGGGGRVVRVGVGVGVG